MHVGAFVFELGDVKISFIKLGLKPFDLVQVRFHGFIESSRQGIGRLSQLRRGIMGGAVGALLRSLNRQRSVLRDFLRRSCDWAVGLKSVLGIVSTRILGVFVRGTLVISERTRSERHWKV